MVETSRDFQQLLEEIARKITRKYSAVEYTYVSNAFFKLLGI
jgi:hypothetical protein